KRPDALLSVPGISSSLCGSSWWESCSCRQAARGARPRRQLSTLSRTTRSSTETCSKWACAPWCRELSTTPTEWSPGRIFPPRPAVADTCRPEGVAMATPLEMADARSRAARAATQAWPRASTLTLLRSHVAGLSILVLFQIIGSLATLVPLLAIVELGRILWGPGTADSSRIWFVVLFGAAGLLIRLAFTGAATAVGHVIDGRAQLSLRLRVASHLGRAPLAWLIRRRSVELSKVVGDDISALHPVIAHTPAQLVDAFVVPAASLIYLLSIDWRMTLITLIPVGAAIAMVPLMMTPAKLDAEREFDAAMSSLRT